MTENLGLDSLIGDTAQATYIESDKRVRKALKLIAFYLEVRRTVSADPLVFARSGADSRRDHRRRSSTSRVGASASLSFCPRLAHHPHLAATHT